jgi:hypothetical protein
MAAPTRVKSGARCAPAPRRTSPTWAVAEPEASAPAIVVPPRSLTPLVVGAAALALGGGAVYAVHRWRQQQRVALDTGTAGARAERPGRPRRPRRHPPAPEAPASEAPARRPPPIRARGGPRSGASMYRPLFTKIEEVTGMPLRLYLCVVANREAGWSRTARNKTKVEVKASADGIDNGHQARQPGAEVRGVDRATPARAACSARSRRSSHGPAWTRTTCPTSTRTGRSSRTRSSSADLRREVLSAHRRRRALPGVRQPLEAVARGQLPRAARVGEPLGAQEQSERHALPGM